MDWAVKLYKGTFNWHCELHTLYTHAKSKNKAFNNFIIQLHTLLKGSRRNIYLNFIDEEGKKYNIKEVKITNAKES